MDGEVGTLQDQWARTPLTAAATAAPRSGRQSRQPQRTGSGGAQRAMPTPAAYQDGRPFAIMYIPRFGADWHKPVLDGSGTWDLQHGLGHYASTARLGSEGNFAVAGHRRTYGNPFNDFPELRPGDAVVLTDGVTWYTYVIDRRPYLTLPNDIGVIDPVPAPLDTSARSLSDADHVRPALGAQPPADRLGPPGLDTAR